MCIEEIIRNLEIQAKAKLQASNDMLAKSHIDKDRKIFYRSAAKVFGRCATRYFAKIQSLREFIKNPVYCHCGNVVMIEDGTEIRDYCFECFYVECELIAQ